MLEVKGGMMDVKIITGVINEQSVCKNNKVDLNVC